MTETTDMSMSPYTASPRPPVDADALRRRIPGWGVDADPKDRPSYPRERFDLELALGGAAPDRVDAMPVRQIESWPRERSIEHSTLPAVFGTSCPPKGLSGAIRKLAYARYSEARAAHWLLLLGADRVDAVEAHLRSFLTTRPDNPLTQTGIRAEVRGHGWSSRVGQRRTDLVHQPLDPVIVAAPWIAAGGAAFVGARKVARVIGGRR